MVFALLSNLIITTFSYFKWGTAVRISSLQWIIATCGTSDYLLCSLPGWFDLFDYPISESTRDDPIGQLKAVNLLEDAIDLIEHEEGIPPNRVVVGECRQMMQQIAEHKVLTKKDTFVFRRIQSRRSSRNAERVYTAKPRQGTIRGMH